MTADALKAALAASGWKMCPLPDEAHCGSDPEPCALCVKEAARAIAAFLRALPDEMTHEGGEFWYRVPIEESTRLWLAAAVERAAREGGG